MCEILGHAGVSPGNKTFYFPKAPPTRGLPWCEFLGHAGVSPGKKKFYFPTPRKMCKTPILSKGSLNILALPLGPMAHAVFVC